MVSRVRWDFATGEGTARAGWPERGLLASANGMFATGYARLKTDARTFPKLFRTKYLTNRREGCYNNEVIGM